MSSGICKIIFLMGGLIGFSKITLPKSLFLRHRALAHVPFDFSTYEERLRQKQEDSTLQEIEWDLLYQLAAFELGRFLLANKRLNGYWSAYLTLYGQEKKNLHPLEKWILHQAPLVKANQERFYLFRQILQARLREGIKVASIPCGLMDDLLGLDYEGLKEVTLVGIDLDAHSLMLAKENAQKQGLKNVRFYQKDAWKLDSQEEYDLIASHGLNFFAADPQKIVALYEQFHQALKPGGFLVSSFLTPPPVLSKNSPWREVNPEDARKQIALLRDIVGVKWQNFLTENQTRAHLQKAGFKVLAIIYDKHRIFPTILAQKT